MKCQMTVHEIQKGDTLYKLAKQYKTTVPLILLANPGVNPYNLRVGDKLNICEGQRFEEKQGLDELQIVSDFNKVVYQYLGFLQLYMASFSGTEERTEQSLEYLLEVPGELATIYSAFYPVSMTSRLSQIFTAYTEKLADYARAVYTGERQNISALRNEIDEQAVKIGEFLEKQNDKYIGRQISDFLQSLNGAVEEAAKQSREGNLRKELFVYQEMGEQGTLFARVLADGIIEQFYKEG